MKRAIHEKLDKTDYAILHHLQNDAKQAFHEIAEKVFVSTATVYVRVKKMEELGVIKGAYLDLNYVALGFDVTAFLGIYLQSSILYDSVVQQLQEIPEVVEMHYTTGAYSMFVKIICRDTSHLREVLHDKIQKVEGIQRTETLVSLEESLKRQLPLNSLATAQ